MEQCEKFVHSDTYPSSLGVYIREKFSEYLSSNNISEDELTQYMEIYDWNKRFQVIDNSCDNLNELSAKFWGDYKCDTNDGQTHISFSNGFSSIVDLLATYLPKNSLITSCPIANIDWSKDTIRITSNDDRVFHSDAVIVTNPLGVLKSSQDFFTPVLPYKMSKTISAMGYKGICKIFLVFSTKWWQDTEGFQIIWKWNRGYGDDWTRYLTGFDWVHGQPNMLVGWVGAKGAEIVENLPEESIGASCTNLLRKFTKNEDIPYPVKVIK